LVYITVLLVRNCFS